MVEEFVINRDDWARGRQSLLLGVDGKMCCLGFFSLACGLVEDDIRELDGPADAADSMKIAEILNNEAPWLLNTYEWEDDSMVENGQDTQYLMEINDDSATDDECKEEEIVRTFAENGVKVTFVE